MKSSDTKYNTYMHAHNIYTHTERNSFMCAKISYLEKGVY